MIAYLGLGSNLGDRLQQLRKAVTALSKRLSTICVCSSVYESSPWGYTEQPDFLNLVVSVRVGMDPWQLLEVCHQVESDLGRRARPRWHEREIDIDILLAGSLTLREPQLTIPHPALRERDFVLVPLLEVEPHLVDPQNGRPLSDYLSKTPALKLYHEGALAC